MNMDIVFSKSLFVTRESPINIHKLIGQKRRLSIGDDVCLRINP